MNQTTTPNRASLYKDFDLESMPEAARLLTDYQTIHSTTDTEMLAMLGFKDMDVMDLIRLGKLRLSAEAIPTLLRESDESLHAVMSALVADAAKESHATVQMALEIFTPSETSKAVVDAYVQVESGKRVVNKAVSGDISVLIYRDVPQ